MLIILGLLQCILLCYPVYSNLNRKEFTTIYEWTQLEFDYPSENEREVDIENGIFIQGAPAPIDVDVYYPHHGGSSNKMFITVPRFQAGVPAALGTLSGKKFNGNPVITPYPNWNWHRDPELCKHERIVSVYRVKIDECGRLWVLDTGRLIEKIICPPQVLIFDLKTNRLIHKYDIPQDQYESRSIFVTPVVEVLDKNSYCQNSFAYLADAQTFSIVVYDFKHDRSWKITDKTMYPNPAYGTFTIEGDSFDLMDGILGLSLSPTTDRPNERKLFYHPMASSTEHFVYTSHLRNQSLFTVSQPSLFHTFLGKRQTQSIAESIDSNGIMYFGLASDVKMACYNTKAGDYGSWKSSDIVGDNPVTLQFPSGVKVVANKRGEEELWILTSRFQKVITRRLNLHEINYRILAAKVNNLISGTQCAAKNIDDILTPFPVHPVDDYRRHNKPAPARHFGGSY